MTSTAERDPTIQQTLASLDKQALDDYLYDLFRGLDPIETDESGTSTDEANSDDFDMVKDDCSEGTTDDEYGMIAHEKEYTQSPDEKSTQESKKLQDTKVQAELKYLHSQLNRINDEETFLMATSKRTEQYIKNCLEECASMRLDVRCRLKTLDEDRKSIASRFEELCCPDLAERKRKKESATQAPPAEKSCEALKSRSRGKTESNLTATSKIEPSPATVPAVTIRPIKDVDDSVSSSKASTRPLLEHSGPEIPKMLTREIYTKPYSDEVYDASARTPFTFDGISSGSGTAPPNPYIPVGFSFLPPTTPQQPCTRQYPSYYPSAGSGWQSPAKGNFPPLGTYSCLPPTSLFGSKVPPSPGSPPPYLNYIPPYQPTPGPSPAFYGNASYPQFQWTAPYTQSPWRV